MSFDLSYGLFEFAKSFPFFLKSVGLLLGIIEGQPEIGQLLIPPLMNLGLTGLLINLLSVEMSKLTKERIPERYGRITTKGHQVLVNGNLILVKTNTCHALLCSM